MLDTKNSEKWPLTADDVIECAVKGHFFFMRRWLRFRCIADNIIWQNVSIFNRKPIEESIFFSMGFFTQHVYIVRAASRVSHTESQIWGNGAVSWSSIIVTEVVKDMQWPCSMPNCSKFIFFAQDSIFIPYFSAISDILCAISYIAVVSNGNNPKSFVLLFVLR